MKYLLDANVFIQAKKSYYQPEIVPSFWQFLKQEEDLYMIEAVKKEIEKGDDFLLIFIKEIKLFSYSQLQYSKEISNYIYKNYHNQAQQEKFLGKADYLLVCLAKQEGLVIVTHEAKVGDNSEKVKIPNICEAFNIGYLNTFDMLRKKEINLCEYKN